MTFAICLPASNSSIRGSDWAMRSKSDCEASAGTVTRPRTLPLTCIGISISAVLNQRLVKRWPRLIRRVTGGCPAIAKVLRPYVVRMEKAAKQNRSSPLEVVFLLS